MNAIDQAIQSLNAGQKKYKDIVTSAYNPIIESAKSLFTRSPGTYGQLDPGSLYGQYTQNPQNAINGAVMGMVTPIKTTPQALGMISNADRNIMGKFAEMVEKGSGKSNLGQVGKDAARIADFFGIDANASNNAIKKYFNEIIKTMDQRGIRPVVEPK